MRIACLHTAESNISVFETASRALELDRVHLEHEVRADLLARAEQAGGLTEAGETATVSALHAMSQNAEAVLLTCSTLGPSVAKAQSTCRVPVLRVDEALAELAAGRGGTIIVLCAVETTLAPTRVLFEEASRKTGAVVEVKLVPTAWEIFKAGRRDDYLATIAAAADRAFEAGAGTVALAQASMAGAIDLCRRGIPLASPTAGLLAAVKAVETSRLRAIREGSEAHSKAVP